MLSSPLPDPPAEGPACGDDSPATSGNNLRDAMKLPEGLVGEGLESVLDQILSVTESDGTAPPPDSRLRQELLKTAESLGHLDFCPDPVLMSMVGAVTGRFRGLSESQHQLLTKSVVNSLYDDVTSRERLGSLWQHLVRLAGHAE